MTRPDWPRFARAASCRGIDRGDDPLTQGDGDEGGTALPIIVERTVRFVVGHVNQSGNVCRRAASCGVMVRRWLGCTYRPWPIDPNPVVTVGAGLSHHSRP